MAKIYVFNPQAQTGVPVLSISVNRDPTPYQIRFTSRGIDYTPFSTAGERSGGISGNKWAPENDVLVQGVPPPLNYRISLPPPLNADLILYSFLDSMVLLGTNGVLLKVFRPVGGAARRTGPPRRPSREGTAGEANGKVYVFNLFSEGMQTFSPNSLSAGAVPGWSKGGGGQPPIFTPSVLKVGRVLNRHEAPGHFANGDNDVGVLWPSGFRSFSLRIDGNRFPITQDLLLFVLLDRWLLVNQFGVQEADGPITPAETPDKASTHPDPRRRRMAESKGKVYVFNVFGESIEFFSPNSLSAGSIPAWAPLSSEKPFTPAQLAIDRVLNQSEKAGKFVNGVNNVGFQVASGFASFQVTIDGAEFPITQNLVLYVSRNVWTLYNQFGVERASGEVLSALAFGLEPETFAGKKPGKKSGKK